VFVLDHFGLEFTDAASPAFQHHQHLRGPDGVGGVAA